MKFGEQFEFHKIPEWYNKYLDYEKLKELIETFQDRTKSGELVKLNGFWVFTQKKAIIPLDIFKVPAKEKDVTGNEYGIRVCGDGISQNNPGTYSMVQASFDAKEQRFSGLQGMTADRAGSARQQQAVSNAEALAMPKRSSNSISKNLPLDQDEIQEITKISMNLEVQINQIWSNNQAEKIKEQHQDIMLARDSSAARGSLLRANEIKPGYGKKSSSSMSNLAGEAEQMLEKQPAGNRGVTEIDLENPDFNMMREQFEIDRPEIQQFPKKLNKKIIKNLEMCSVVSESPSEKKDEQESKRQKDEEVLKKTESDLLMKEWIAEFTAEIDEIDNFYTTKFNIYAKEFIDMQAKYLSKMALDQEIREQAQDEKKKNKNEGNGNQAQNKKAKGRNVFQSPIDGKLIIGNSGIQKQEESIKSGSMRESGDLGGGSSRFASQTQGFGGEKTSDKSGATLQLPMGEIGKTQLQKTTSSGNLSNNESPQNKDAPAFFTYLDQATKGNNQSRSVIGTNNQNQSGQYNLNITPDSAENRSVSGQPDSSNSPNRKDIEVVVVDGSEKGSRTNSMEKILRLDKKRSDNGDTRLSMQPPINVSDLGSQLTSTNLAISKSASQYIHSSQSPTTPAVNASFRIPRQSVLSNQPTKDLAGLTARQSYLLLQQETPEAADVAIIITDEGDSLKSRKSVDAKKANVKHNSNKQNIQRSKDEFEFATNWSRVFMNTYQHLKWLNAYALINHLAMQKILKKFVKVHFDLKDNVIDKNLMAYIDAKAFAHRRQLAYLIQDLKWFYADKFHGGSVEKAGNTLENYNREMRRSDLAYIMFFSGASLVMLLFGVFFLWIPDQNGDYEIGEIVASLQILRLSFVCIFVLLAAGVATKIFNAYKINYLFIFEIDQHKKMNADQLFKVSAFLGFIWTLCFTMTVIEEKLTIFHGLPAVFMVILFIGMLFYCVQPCFKCGYRTARYQLLLTFLEIFKAPFGRVRFRDFFFADVLTSVGTTLQDFGIAVYYITSQNFKNYDPDHYQPPDISHSLTLGIFLIWCGFCPYWFRFGQCLNKYYYSGVKAHLLNAGKYFSKLVVPFALLVANGWRDLKHNKHLGEDYFTIYFVFQTIATVYCAAWDYYMDWGLWRSTEPGKYGLRPKMSYSPKFYYIASAVNLFLRFFWVFQIFTIQWADPDAPFAVTYKQLQLLTFAAVIAEAFRRAQWALLRVENEFHNNFEAYRSIPQIPGLADDVKLD